MGPPLFSDGNQKTFAHLRNFTKASMGPPLFSDGNEKTFAHLRNFTKASMGPPLFSDGNERNSCVSVYARFQLQWGRRFSATETRKPGAVPIVSVALQWGRRFSATETTLITLTMVCRLYRFNGAAAFQRRKHFFTDASAG